MLCAVVLNDVYIELRYGKLFNYNLEEIALVVESEYENAFLSGSFRTFGNCEREVISVVFVDRCSHEVGHVLLNAFGSYNFSVNVGNYVVDQIFGYVFNVDSNELEYRYASREIPVDGNSGGSYLEREFYVVGTAVRPRKEHNVLYVYGYLIYAGIGLLEFVAEYLYKVDIVENIAERERLLVSVIYDSIVLEYRNFVSRRLCCRRGNTEEQRIVSRLIVIPRCYGRIFERKYYSVLAYLSLSETSRHIEMIFIVIPVDYLEGNVLACVLYRVADERRIRKFLNYDFRYLAVLYSVCKRRIDFVAELEVILKLFAERNRDIIGFSLYRRRDFVAICILSNVYQESFAEFFEAFYSRAERRRNSSFLNRPFAVYDSLFYLERENYVFHTAVFPLSGHILLESESYGVNARVSLREAVALVLYDVKVIAVGQIPVGYSERLLAAVVYEFIRIQYRLLELLKSLLLDHSVDYPVRIYYLRTALESEVIRVYESYRYGDIVRTVCCCVLRGNDLACLLVRYLITEQVARQFADVSLDSCREYGNQSIFRRPLAGNDRLSYRELERNVV